MNQQKTLANMSKNKKYIYEGIPHEFYEGEMSDLGYKSEKEAVEYAMKLFDERVSKSNIKILGHDIDFPD
jgi:hypothetical protein